MLLLNFKISRHIGGITPKKCISLVHHYQNFSLPDINIGIKKSITLFIYAYSLWLSVYIFACRQKTVVNTDCLE